MTIRFLLSHLTLLNNVFLHSHWFTVITVAVAQSVGTRLGNGQFQSSTACGLVAGEVRVHLLGTVELPLSKALNPPKARGQFHHSNICPSACLRVLCVHVCISGLCVNN